MGSFLLACALIVSAPRSHAADLFWWTDDAGVTHLTDNQDAIPSPFRGKIISIQERVTMESPAGPSKTTLLFPGAGRVAAVPATLNDLATVNLVVDTGATHTMISPATAHSIGIRPENHETTLHFQTANGQVLAPVAELKSIRIGGREVRGLKIAIHDLFLDTSLAGLLGMDFLSHFRVELDMRGQILILEPLL
jgi:clan AA aspartic protease (TIGR02281 family)